MCTHIILYIRMHAHVLHARTLQLLLLMLCIMYSAHGTPQVFVCIMQFAGGAGVLCVHSWTTCKYTMAQPAVHVVLTNAVCVHYCM